MNLPWTAERPLLLLDVDGVLCPMGRGCGDELLEFAGPEYPVWYSAGTPRRLRTLGEVFTLVWATNWEDQANLVLAPALGLPQLPIIRFPARRGQPGESLKLQGVQAFVGTRPLAWLDDEVGDDMVAWALARPQPTLVHAVDPRLGLSDGDVDALLHFGRRVHSLATRPGGTRRPEPALLTEG